MAMGTRDERGRRQGEQSDGFSSNLDERQFPRAGISE